MARMKQAHTSTSRGKRVIVWLKSGVHIIDRFLEKKNNTVIFQNHKIPQGDILRFIPYNKSMGVIV